jgi:hypothetical protein
VFSHTQLSVSELPLLKPDETLMIIVASVIARRGLQRAHKPRAN